MRRIITELKKHPAAYAAALLIATAAYFAGGKAALELEAPLRTRIAGFFYGGGTYWRVVLSIAEKRLVLIAIQAFCCIWMVGMPISVCAGMLQQTAASLPLWCLADSFAKGLAIAICSLPAAVVQILCGCAASAAALEHFGFLMKEFCVKKSSRDILAEGFPTMRRILGAGVIMLLTALPEAAIAMHIAAPGGI